MNILVLGGSYFLGKHFVVIASKEHAITVQNRGNRPLHLAGVSELVGERHDAQAFLPISRLHYDAVVDFCAYEKGDIEFIFENLKGGFEQYVFISTCDVYERGLGRLLDESAPLEQRQFGGDAGNYISGKVALEEELAACAGKAGVAYTSIRPAFIYGPGNYAPREEMYFNWIESAGQILHPEDATGEFQMVYVRDVARGILAAIGDKASYGCAYNFAPLPTVTYESFADALQEAADKPFTKIPVNVRTVNERQIPLPFPLTREESNWYDGSAALRLIGSYTPLCEGLKETREASAQELFGISD